MPCDFCQLIITMMNNLAFSVFLSFNGRHIGHGLNVLSHSILKMSDQISNNLAATLQMSADEYSVQMGRLSLDYWNPI